MELNELKELTINTKNNIIYKNNLLQSNYNSIEYNNKKIKSLKKLITKDVLTIFLSFSIICGSGITLGINTKNERRSKLDSGIYTVEQFNNNRNRDYLTAYFGYVLVLFISYYGINFIKKDNVFKKFFIKLVNNYNEYKKINKDINLLFNNMDNDIMYLLGYITQFKEYRNIFYEIIENNPYLENDMLVTQINKILSSIDIDEIMDDIHSKKRKLM